MRRILTAEDIRALVGAGRAELVLDPGAVMTDAARDEADLAGLRIVEGPQDRRGGIVISVAGEEIHARLLFDEAPLTAAAISDLLPLSGTVNHARLAGDELMFPIRTYIGPENQSKAQKAGNIAYWPDRMIIAMFYGDTDGVGLTNVFAKVTSDLESFRRAGDHVWKNQGVELRIDHRLT